MDTFCKDIHDARGLRESLGHLIERLGSFHPSVLAFNWHHVYIYTYFIL